jgi:hypothetical protein
MVSPKESSEPDSPKRLSPYLEKLVACLGAESDADLWPEFGKAGQWVRQLAEIEWKLEVQWNSEGIPLELRHKRDELIQIICREYPEAAKKLGLPRPAAGGAQAHGVKTCAETGTVESLEEKQGVTNTASKQPWYES